MLCCAVLCCVVLCWFVCLFVCLLVCLFVPILFVCLISALSCTLLACQCFLQLATGLLPGNSSMVFGTGLLDPGSLGLPKMVSVVSHAAMQLVVFRLPKKDWCSHWSCCIPGRKWSGLCLSCWNALGRSIPRKKSNHNNQAVPANSFWKVRKVGFIASSAW